MEDRKIIHKYQEISITLSTKILSKMKLFNDSEEIRHYVKLQQQIEDLEAEKKKIEVDGNLCVEDRNMSHKYQEISITLFTKILSKIKMSFDNKEVRNYVKLQQQIEDLESEKKKIEPLYYAAIMRNCNHVFADWFYTDDKQNLSNSETNSNKNSSFVYRYCLKCGLDTYGIQKYEDKVKKLRIKETPTVKVDCETQNAIAKSSEVYSVIDCGQINISDIIMLWKNINKENSQLPFEQLVDIFKLRIEELRFNKDNGLRR